MNSYGTGLFVALDKTIEAYTLEIFRDKSDAFGKLFVALYPQGDSMVWIADCDPSLILQTQCTGVLIIEFDIRFVGNCR